LRRFASLARINTSAAAPSEIELELAAVTVPPSRNAGLSFGINGGDLARERSVLVGLPGALQALGGKGVLRLAGELVVLGRVLGEGAHQPALVVGVLEAVEEHVVLDLGMAEPGAAAHFRQQVGRVGHALHAAGNDDVRRPRVQRIIGQHHRLHPGAAHLVDGGAGHGMRQAGGDRGLARRGLALSGWQNAAHVHFGYILGRDAWAVRAIPAMTIGSCSATVMDFEPHLGWRCGDGTTPATPGQLRVASQRPFSDQSFIIGLLPTSNVQSSA
jgi:hypothetical protein